MGLWKSIKRAARGVGKFIRKNWKVIVGVAAAVAVPFVAPMIGSALAGSLFLKSVAPGVASFLGSNLGSAAIGAGLGGLAAGATGQNPLLGAALGGVGGFAGAAGGLGNMFGGIGSATSAPLGAAAGAAPAVGAGGAVGGGQGIVALGAAGSAAAPAASSGVIASLGSLATKLATNPRAIGALGQLAMTMFNKDLNELTPEEEAQLEEVAAQAATNRGLFEQQVMEARKLIQAGTPNPEQAYANARFQTEAQLDEVMRGMPAGLQENAERKAAIASSKAGLQGVAVNYAQAADMRRAGINSMPDQAPTGYSQLAMPTYNSLYERRNDYDEQIGKGIGNLFGSLA